MTTTTTSAQPAAEAPGGAAALSQADLGRVAPGATAASGEDLETLARQLGRVPRGVVGVAARCKCGNPLVVITAPRLEDGTPFPTVFYLTSPQLTRVCSTLEAEQLMESMNQQLSSDPHLQAGYQAAHEDYLRRREQLGEVPEIAGITAGGMPRRVKCLHALVAHSLAAGPGVNPFGDQTLDELAARGMWDGATCRCRPDH